MNKKIGIIGIVVLLAVTSFFLFNGKTTGNVIQDNNVKEFTVDAFRFGYNPDSIIVNLGDKVRIVINNIDTLHGIRIPELKLKGNEILEFTANQTGEFTWYCANMCGNGHMQMQGKLIIK